MLIFMLPKAIRQQLFLDNHDHDTVLQCFEGQREDQKGKNMNHYLNFEQNRKDRKTCTRVFEVEDV